MASGDDCLKFWHDKYWDKNFTPWQLTEPHKHLVANKDLLLGEGKVRVLVPLCGKTVDLKYLYDLGHEVVGVEGCAEAAKQFFKENGIEYVLGNDGITYQSLDKRLTIVNQNFFTVAGDYVHYFDCVWDRGGLWSVLPHHRGRFVDSIRRLMKSSFKYLLVAWDYDLSKHNDGESPFCVTLSDVEELFSGFANVQLLRQIEQGPDCKDFRPQRFIKAGLVVNQLVILISK